MDRSHVVNGSFSDHRVSNPDLSMVQEEDTVLLEESARSKFQQSKRSHTGKMEINQNTRLDPAEVASPAFRRTVTD